MGASDQPVVRKKRQAKEKNKSKKQVYSQKHIRLMEQLVSKKILSDTNNGK
jgi:hypothetical protein